MSYRLSKIYTKTGDAGYTTLGDTPISKDDLLVEAVGTIDELNSQIGFVLAQPIQNTEVILCLTRIQHELFDLGGELHLPRRIAITPDKVTELEKQLDAWNATLPRLKEFLLPRGNPSSAACHVARAVCRRAERALVRLHRQTALSNPDLIRYLNRLSDLLFVCARILAREDKQNEILWEHEKKEKP
jgi:cob(I)alamin adenosyltransferase